MSVAETRTRWLVGFVLVALSGVALWFALTPEERAPQGEPAAVSSSPPEPAVELRERVPISPEPPVFTRPDVREETAILASQHREVVGARPHDPHEPGMLPHPLDETRQRINAENQLMQSLNDAMSFRRVGEMREMLVEYRKLDPEDIDAHQLGYEVIADCIEFPGDASLSAAREFYDTQRHSPLRRFVRRICFENSH